MLGQYHSLTGSALHRCTGSARYDPMRMVRWSIHLPLGGVWTISRTFARRELFRSSGGIAAEILLMLTGWRHVTTSPGRLPAIRSATAVETAVWANLPTVSLICVSFTLFLSHHPSDATCDVTGCSPPSWWRSASSEAAASRFYSACRCYFPLKVRDVPIYSLSLTDAL